MSIKTQATIEDLYHVLENGKAEIVEEGEGDRTGDGDPVLHVAGELGVTAGRDDSVDRDRHQNVAVAWIGGIARDALAVRIGELEVDARGHIAVGRGATHIEAAHFHFAAGVEAVVGRSHVAAESLHITKLRAYGQRVAPGTPLMAVVPLDDVWVDANFKEVQLKDMRVGQPVEVRSDLYGHGIKYRGKLVGLSAGSGSAFALLPAQNASGNWIKIVQRVPVRIALDPQQLAAHPLRVGLSTTVIVDIRDTSGALIASQVRSEPIPAQSSLGNDPEVKARIARILAANGGAGAVTKAAMARQ